MEEEYLVSIIIVTYNGKKWLNRCLNSLYRQTYKNFEIILVDNCSTDGSIEHVKENYPDVIVIENRKNLGFGVANNIGIARSVGDIIFLMNNDTDAAPDMLEKMLIFKKETKFNIVGPRILNTEKKDTLNGKYLQLDILGAPGGPSDKLFYIEGCALMMSRRDFNVLGKFDEKYFMYSEDTDLCWRAHLYRMTLGICDETHIVHYGGGSSLETQARENERHTTSVNRRYWVESHNLRNLLKNYSIATLLWVLPLFVLQNICESFAYLLTGNIKMNLMIWKSFLWNMMNISDTIKQRKIIQRERLVSDEKVLCLMYFGSYKFSAFRQLGMPKFK
ncbi:MAG: Glycosyltransferase, group 2 family protein [Candidatus Moranbacteria bacterium GW2011_GWC2_37_8]|nr:MAG: Glycosyltransferase, group 2 family protein [Candidatus Moranbacteria bacterium GW2011_GWC2_37_8]KKQ62562.1 MAG: dTDP-4-dehydrorhamnose reductase, RfbD, dTDP-4-dehydrorhamnose reductase [Parcubacteria group bacterium GW2011_GWC1_38_22]KKQ80737.1 MAG: Glycosyltransferase, group 2 family protein [Candidatus Moranbacteria bacterium GW2011_GWD2_38_7]